MHVDKCGFLACVLALALSTIASAAAAQSVRIEILDYGVYSAEVQIPSKGLIPSELKAAGLANICHVATTSIVSKRDGVKFGFRYRIDGGSQGATVHLRQSVTYPDHSHPPESLKSSVMTSETKPHRIGDKSYLGWNNNRTTLPGVWTLQLSEGAHTLASMTFTVVDEADAPKLDDSVSDCFSVSGLAPPLLQAVAHLQQLR